MPGSFKACGSPRNAVRRTWRFVGSEICAKSLLALDRLEQRLEVPLAEAPCTVALDHLEEKRRAILRGLREDLEEVAVLVAVGEDAQPAEVVPVLADLADALADVLVVRVGRREKDDTLVLERLDGPHDVLRLQRDMLDAGAAEVLEVLLDLALPLPLGGLVDRELDLPLPVGHHLRHERGVLGVDLLVGEVDDVREAHRALVELDPVIHPAELDVADDVVDRPQADTGGRPAVRTRDFLKAREEWTGVVPAVDEGVDVLAVRRDRRQLDTPEVVFDPVRVDHAARTALHRLAVRLTRVRDCQRRVLDTVYVRA